jgi:hypothetical protein
MKNICEQVVEDARYLEAAGMTERQLTSLHHRSKESYNSLIRYWSVETEPRPRSLDYTYRLRFIAREQRATNQPLDVLVARALSKWPVTKI